MSSELKILTRDVEASVVPVGTKVTLQKGEQAHITQSLGGTYTVIVNGNMFRIESKDGDALGIEAPVGTATATPSGPLTLEELEKNSPAARDLALWRTRCAEPGRSPKG